MVLPVFGFVLDLLSIMELGEELVWANNAPLPYVLTRKLSQDHLELFFSSIRSRTGNNNNPTALEFRSSYRNCLIARIDPSRRGNCLSNDDTNVLLLDSINKGSTKELIQQFDHDYIPEYSSLSLFCENVVQYIAGNVVQACAKKITCEDCLDCLYESNDNKSGFIKVKDVKDSLVNPSRDIVKLFLMAEKVIRARGDSMFKSTKNLMLSLQCETMQMARGQLFATSSHLFCATDLTEESHYSLKVAL